MREKITYQQEFIPDFFEDFIALIARYYEDAAIRDGLPMPDMDREQYEQRHAANSIVIITARNEANTLIGCAVYMLGHHPHYKGQLWAFCGTLAVHPDHRRKRIGSTMVEAAMHKLRDRGVRFVTNNHRVVYNVAPLFPKLGFKLMEYSYVKELV
jgi:GNAT superfamily N-acetyltransferase